VPRWPGLFLGNEVFAATRPGEVAKLAGAPVMDLGDLKSVDRENAAIAGRWRKGWDSNPR
jgi:hypothetical protein